MLVGSWVSVCALEWVWASEILLRAFAPLEAWCSRSGDIWVRSHCMQMQALGPFCLLLALAWPHFYTQSSGSLLPSILLCSWIGAPFLLPHGEGIGLECSIPLWERGEGKQNPNQLQSKYSLNLFHSFSSIPCGWVNDGLPFPSAPWWHVLREEKNSSRHRPRISEAFLRGSHAWVVGLVKLSATALSAVTHSPAALGGVFIGPWLEVRHAQPFSPVLPFDLAVGICSHPFFVLAQFLLACSLPEGQLRLSGWDSPDQEKAHTSVWVTQALYIIVVKLIDPLCGNHSKINLFLKIKSHPRSVPSTLLV